MSKQVGVSIWRSQVRLPAPLADFISKMARENYRSMNEQIVEIVREAKRRSEEKSQQQ